MFLAEGRKETIFGRYDDKWKSGIYVSNLPEIALYN